MTAELTRQQDLPRTDDLRSMPYRLGLPMRVVVKRYFARRYDLRVHHEELFPRTGPVLMTPNHLSLLDGPLLGAIAPRMLHQLAKIEAFGGLQGWFLHRVGQMRCRLGHGLDDQQRIEQAQPLAA